MSAALDHTEKLLLEKGLMLFEFKANDFNDQPVFAFLLMNKDDFNQFEYDKKNKKEIYYSDYGIVTHVGVGEMKDDDRQTGKSNALEIIKSLI